MPKVPNNYLEKCANFGVVCGERMTNLALFVVYCFGFEENLKTGRMIEAG